MSKRILGYDVARAMAVLGMIIVNYELILTEGQDVEHWLYSVTGLLHGRAAALFVVLAGVGMSLMTARALRENDSERMRSARVLLLKRALFLFIVGLLYTPIWPGDILHVYGFYIATGVVLLTASNRTLWISAGVIVVAFVALLGVIDYEAGWDWETLAYEGMWTFQGLSRRVLYNGFNPAIPWSAFLVAGLAIGRLDLRNATVRRTTLKVSVLVAIATEVLSRVLIWISSEGTSPQEIEEIVAVFGTAPMPPMPLYMVAAGATAIAAIAFFVGFVDRNEDARWVPPLVATGQMALSIYVAHFVIGIGILILVGRLEAQSPVFVVGYALGFFLSSVVFSVLWLRRFDRGPLEIVMRKLTG